MFRNLHLQSLALAAISMLCATTASGATVVDIQRLNINQVNKNYQIANAKLGSTATPVQRHARILVSEPDFTLTLQNSSQDKAGRHYRYQQTFRGLPIFGKQLVVSESTTGNIRALFGNKVSNLATDLSTTTAKLSAAQALNIAKHASMGKRIAAMKTEFESIKKMIYIDDYKRGRLVYVVTFAADTLEGGNPIQPLLVVDANNGRIIAQWSELKTALVGTGPGGNGKTGIYEFGTDYGNLDVAKSGITCTLRNPSVRTADFKNTTSGAVHTFNCPRNTVKSVNGAFSPLNDAHYFGTAVYSMYNSYVGKPPLPYQVLIRVHYGATYNNAAWVNKGVRFGDGNSNTRYPWAVMDLVSHEIAHGFTEQYSGLIYENQSGGLNESYSDMAGEALEFYLTGTNDFLAGKNVVKAANRSLRNLANPPADTKSIDHASKFTDLMDPHYSSGVYNKAFHLLATKPGWDTKKAFQLFSRANDLYWASDSTFNQAACGVLQAATDLAYSTTDITAALSAVGVSCGVVWHSDSALGLYGGPIPTFWDSSKTITSGYEPADGMYGFAARASLYRNSGKRYTEFTFLTHTAASVNPYSGQICLSLRSQSVPVQGDAGMAGDWAICWYTDMDSSPVAIAPPWFRSNGILWGPPLTPGPLNAWRIKQGDTIGIAADLDTGKLWYSLNGVWVGDPAAGSSPAFDQIFYLDKQISGKSVTAHLYTDFQNISVKIRGGQTEMLHPVPAGFVAWGD